MRKIILILWQRNVSSCSGPREHSSEKTWFSKFVSPNSSPHYEQLREITLVSLSHFRQLSPWRRKIIFIPLQNFLPSSSKLGSLFSTDLSTRIERREEKKGEKFEIYPSSYSFKIAYERKYIFHSIPKLTSTNNRVNRIESLLSTDLSIRIDEQTEKRETRKKEKIYIYIHRLVLVWLHSSEKNTILDHEICPEFSIMNNNTKLEIRVPFSSDNYIRGDEK